MSDDLRADLIESLREVGNTQPSSHAGHAGLFLTLAEMLEATGRLTWHPEPEAAAQPQAPAEGSFLQRIVRQGIDGSGPLECAGCQATLFGVNLVHKPDCSVMESLGLIALLRRDDVLRNQRQQIDAVVRDRDRVKGERDRLRSELARIARLALSAGEI